MSVALTIDIDGTESVTAELLRFEHRAEDARPAFRRIADELREIGTERFDSQGPGWAPLADETLRRKLAEGLPGEILHATLALRRSLTEPGGDNIEVMTGDSLVFGTSDPKARWHQDGTSKMPAREVLMVGVDERLRAVKVLQRYLVEGIAR